MTTANSDPDVRFVKEYKYRPKWTTIILCVAFSCLAVVILGSKAAYNDRGLIINRVIELGPTGATVFFWVLTACGTGFVVCSMLLAFHRLTFQQRLVFGPEALTGPVSRWSREEKEIAYRDILVLSEATISGQRFLYVTHADGKYTINAALLPSKAAFAEVCELLVAQVQQARLAEQRHAEPGGPKPTSTE